MSDYKEIIVKEYHNEKGLLTRREVGEELVRCKDCKYWRPDTRPEDSLDERADGLWGYGDLCVKHLPSDQLEAIQFSPDDYCKYGERKDDE